MVWSVGSIGITSRSIAKRHKCNPIYRESSLSLIVLFQHESLSDLVYTQQTQILALRDHRDVVDLTLNSDNEDSAIPVESIAKVLRPVVRDSDHSLIPIEEGHSVGKQHCIRSLGCIKRTVSRTQELLTKIHTICVEIRDIKRTSQKQYIKTPFKGQDKDNPQTTDKCYNTPPHKEEEQGGRPGYSHMVSTSPSPSSPPTDSSDTQRYCVPHLLQHTHQDFPHHLLPMQNLLICYLHLKTHSNPLTGI